MEILWLSGPKGSGKTLISGYLKQCLAACCSGAQIIEYTCSSYRKSTEPTSSEFCRAFINQLVNRHHSHPPGPEPGTIEIYNLVKTLRRALVYSQDMELTLFVNGLESAAREPGQQIEFIPKILDLFQQMETARLFKTIKFMLISRWDVGIQKMIDTASVKVKSIRFNQERAGLFLRI